MAEDKKPMSRRQRAQIVGDRLTAIAGLAVVLLLPPVVMLPGGLSDSAWPRSVMFIFGVWIAVVALVALVVETTKPWRGR